MKNKHLELGLQYKKYLLIPIFIILLISCSSKKVEDKDLEKVITINNIEFKVPSKYKFFTWETLPKDVFFERKKLKKFTNKKALEHYYEVVYIQSGNLNWYQAGFLAQEAGGYLVSINSKEENDFIHNLIKNKKIFWHSLKNTNKESIATFIGAYKIKNPKITENKWAWLSGEKWGYDNWEENLDITIINKKQTNKAFMNKKGKFVKHNLSKKVYSFVIEYEKNPF